jgi:hypothetical protein
MAYEAAEAIMGNNVEEIAEVGSRYPLFTRTVSMANSEYVLDLLKAIPKVTARVVETGLKDIDDVETETEDVEEKEEAPKKSEKKETKATQKPKSKKDAEEEDEADEDDYENMTSKALYKLCCDRGISSQCKKRDKASLIAVLKANDGTANEDEDDWGDEEETDPYAGKSAKELFKMCSDRGIKTKPKQSADAYVKLLKKADEAETDNEEDEDDDWEI